MRKRGVLDITLSGTPSTSPCDAQFRRHIPTDPHTQHTAACSHGTLLATADQRGATNVPRRIVQRCLRSHRCLITRCRSGIFLLHRPHSANRHEATLRSRRCVPDMSCAHTQPQSTRQLYLGGRTCCLWLHRACCDCCAHGWLTEFAELFFMQNMPFFARCSRSLSASLSAEFSGLLRGHRSRRLGILLVAS